jgi:hypothetical protein
MTEITVPINNWLVFFKATLPFRSLAATRVTKYVCEKNTQNVAQPMLRQN